MSRVHGAGGTFDVTRSKSHAAKTSYLVYSEPRMLDRQSSVTAIVSEIEIDAPVDLIWSTILDFPSYTEWNPFVRRQAIMDASWKTTLADQKPVVGSNIKMTVPIPPAVGMTDPSQVNGSTKEVITYLNEDTKTIIWDLVSPPWFLRTRREQTVVEINKDGRKMAKYTSVEVSVVSFSGSWLC